jgi:hypothetical protein
MFVTAPFQVYVALRFIQRHVPFNWSELALSTAKSALVTLFAAAPPAVMVAFIGLDLSIPAAIAAALAAAAGWGAGLAVTGHPLLSEVRNVLHQAGSMLRIYILIGFQELLLNKKV